MIRVDVVDGDLYFVLKAKYNRKYFCYSGTKRNRARCPICGSLCIIDYDDAYEDGYKAWTGCVHFHGILDKKLIFRWKYDGIRRDCREGRR